MFKNGDILRYAAGITALLKVDTALPGHGGSVAYYCGQQCMGGSACAYHEYVQIASNDDVKIWNEREHWRKL